MRRYSLIFLCITLFCGLFSAVYEHFSHDVYSSFMIYLFMFPLVGGALPYAVLGLTPHMSCPTRSASRLYNSGIATLTVGSCVRGVLDIYGTTSVYMTAYWVVGAAFIVIGLTMFYIGAARQRRVEA